METNCQDSLMLSLVVGISSSLVASILIIICAEITRRVLIPFIKDSLYKGVRIDGEWNEDTSRGVSSQDGNTKLSLEQSADKIHGFYTHGDGASRVTYEINGYIKNMYFIATMIPVSNKMVDAATLLMHIDYET